MKYLLILTISLFGLNSMGQQSIHEFKVAALEGGEIDLSEYIGKKILVVNTASECGYTKQYAELQELYEANAENLVIIGFPANDFGAQEPGNNEEIAAFCKKNYGVSFPMAGKVSVKGENQHELFNWLCVQENPDFAGGINWNFEKFLLDEHGVLVRRFRSGVKPMSEEIAGEL